MKDLMNYFNKLMMVGSYDGFSLGNLFIHRYYKTKNYKYVF